jgi:hypothetical protein
MFGYLEQKLLGRLQKKFRNLKDISQISIPKLWGLSIILFLDIFSTKLGTSAVGYEKI